MRPEESLFRNSLMKLELSCCDSTSVSCESKFNMFYERCKEIIEESIFLVPLQTTVLANENNLISNTIDLESTL